MKILLLTQIYPEPDDVDGYIPTKTVAYFARDWVKSGHDVVVIHCQSKFPLAYYLIPGKIKKIILRNSYAILPSIKSRNVINREEDGIKIFRLPMRKLFPSTPFSKSEMSFQMKRIINICDSLGFIPDLVAGHFANPCMELTARLGQFYDSRTSFVFHNDCSVRNIQKYSLDVYKKSIDIIGGRSKIEGNNIRKLLNLDYDPFICYSGIPDEMVNDISHIVTKQESNVLKIIYAGGLVKRKHVDSVIIAFNEFKKNNDIECQLTIIGGGSEEEYLKNLVKKDHNEELVTFTGRLSRNEVLDKMTEANIFVMISEGETFGMVYLEAMLQGCLVIASKGGGFDGLIIDGENGFLCSPGDEKMLLQIFNRINTMSVSNKKRISEAAIDTAEKYSESKVARLYLDCVMEKEK